MDYANHAYSVTLAVSLGQIRTLIEETLFNDPLGPAAGSEASSRSKPGGIRLSIGLEDWHDIINDLQTALEQI